MLTCYDFTMAAALRDLLEGQRKRRASSDGAKRRMPAGSYFISSSRSR
jgi:hypothetical protein